MRFLYLSSHLSGSQGVEIYVEVGRCLRAIDRPGKSSLCTHGRGEAERQ